MRSADDHILELAVARGWVSREEVEAAQASLTPADGTPPGGTQVLRALDASGVLAGRALAQMLAQTFGLKVVELAAERVPREVIALVPRALATKHRVLPLAKEAGTLRVAIGDPLDTEALDDLAHVLNVTVEPVLAPAAELEQAIERHYGRDFASAEALADEVAPVAGEAETTGTGALQIGAGGEASESDAPIIKLVHAMILEAIRRRASDIHLEPLEKRLRVRYRIDGVLLEAENPPKRLQLSIVSRLKLMANISIAEKRIPQDGRIQVTVAGKALDLRVSSLPTVHGESIVMRILDKEGLQLGLPELGFFRDDQQTLERMIALADGIVLVTGPTGSGKTTTLYSCLHHLNRPDRKIITVEDPVEYQLTGVNQVPVRHDVGMTFASALRAMLRQAPNVVMVGEIRDLETAEIAINASLTGHLVFSTLHTNDAPSAVTRLIDIGVKPFLVATSLRAVLAQRLVRRVCKACARPHAPSAQELRALNVRPAEVAGAQFLRGAGCAECNGTGYRGRLGIYEIFAITDEIQHLIYEGVGAGRLREKARALGMRTMREDGLRKVIAGLTTVEEVVSVTVGDAS